MSTESGTSPPPAEPVGNLPTLTPVLDLSVDCDPPIEVGRVPGGTRRIIPITGGSFVGTGENKISGEILPGGADWNLQRGDGVFEVWARYLLRTDDGATITITNEGLIRIGESGLVARTVPRFEVADEQYRWLAQAVMVGTLAARTPFTGVELRMYRVD